MQYNQICKLKKGKIYIKNDNRELDVTMYPKTRNQTKATLTNIPHYRKATSLVGSANKNLIKLPAVTNIPTLFRDHYNCIPYPLTVSNKV